MSPCRDHLTYIAVHDLLFLKSLSTYKQKNDLHHIPERSVMFTVSRSCRGQERMMAMVHKLAFKGKVVDIKGMDRLKSILNQNALVSSRNVILGEIVENSKSLVDLGVHCLGVVHKVNEVSVVHLE
jgi:hypothetical protein